MNKNGVLSGIKTKIKNRENRLLIVRNFLNAEKPTNAPFYQKERLKLVGELIELYFTKIDHEQQMKMKPIQVTWTSNNDFDSMHTKILLLVGERVVNNSSADNPFTIFKVGSVKEDNLEDHIGNLCRFFNGDKRFIGHHGDFNFNSPKKIPVWQFCVDYGVEDAAGNRSTQTYSFYIPRTDDYKKDVAYNKYVIDESHPFVSYPDLP